MSNTVGEMKPNSGQTPAHFNKLGQYQVHLVEKFTLSCALSLALETKVLSNSSWHPSFIFRARNGALQTLIKPATMGKIRIVFRGKTSIGVCVGAFEREPEGSLDVRPNPCLSFPTRYGQRFGSIAQKGEVHAFRGSCGDA